MSKRILISAVFIAWLLSACSNYDDRERLIVAPPIKPITLPGPPVEPMAIAGTWFSRAENNAVNCGSSEYVDGKSVVISQDSANISMLLSSGDVFTGTVNGDIVEWTGSFPERNGMTDFTSTSVIFSTDSGTGNAAWTWTDGNDSCNGTMVLSYDKDATVESGSNSWPAIADQFEFTDNVAFFTGTLGNGGDTFDYFSFTADQDSVLQVELSHFDTAANNLDLAILDENLQVVAASTSADAFELLELEVTGGVRYFVEVGATALSSPDNYNLALDIN